MWSVTGNPTNGSQSCLGDKPNVATIWCLCQRNNAVLRAWQGLFRFAMTMLKPTVKSVAMVWKLSRRLPQTKRPDEKVKILTHCNAGWLATVDWGTATSPIYHAAEAAIDVHVWVDETRPRNQGAQLTTWEMASHDISHQLIVDNAGGHLMQHGEVDIVIVGTDRTTANGDVCNKIGTYLKALAARDNNIPFYVALPSTTIDWNLQDGVREIPIEERDGEEVTKVWGKLEDGNLASVQICPDNSPTGNPAFDVTPARLVTGLITERGICEASREGLAAMFPELVGRSHITP